jgi:hypothetical protein
MDLLYLFIKILSAKEFLKCSIKNKNKCAHQCQCGLKPKKNPNHSCQFDKNHIKSIMPQKWNY